MLSYLVKKTWWQFFATVGCSLIFGTISVSLVALINEIINSSTDMRVGQFQLFAVLAAGGVVLQLISKVVAERLSEQSQAELRKFVASKTIDAKLSHIEQEGPAKIKSCLTEHSLKVAGFFISLPSILTNAMIVLGAFIYMAWLDWQVFLFAVVTLVIGSVGYSIANSVAYKKISEAANLQDDLYLQFDAITEGAKELKLNRAKRNFFRDHVLGPALDKVKEKRVQGASIYHMASSWGGFTVFSFIGGALYFLSLQDVAGSQKVMSGFALLFLYMLTPLEVLLGSIPAAMTAKVSAQTITELTDQLDSDVVDQQPSFTDFNTLEFCQLSHHYYHEQSDDVFGLQPINLHIEKGELIYLVGGNGSGKTTFAKVLCGLYEANEGQIMVDNHLISSGKLDDYRQLFTTVFGDYHLFDRLLTISDQSLEEKGNVLIQKLNLHHKVMIEQGAFSTQKLSQGQRKRLALVVAYLEDRPFYLFDEWAADQDPVFKDVFYTELLPELKAKGKTILVITHDDKYFSLADRLLRMENGCLSEIQKSIYIHKPHLEIQY